MQSIGDVMTAFIRSSKWKSRLDQIKVNDSYPKVMGNTITRYTKQIYFNNGTLTIYTDVAPLKHELLMAKEQLKKRFNEYLGEEIIKEVAVR